jgi:hypothetical protein
MAPSPSFPYAQLPVFKYQTFDNQSLTYSEYPIIPPTSSKMTHFGEGADADEQPKNGEAPADPPADSETSDPPIEIIDLSTNAPTDGA